MARCGERVKPFLSRLARRLLRRGVGPPFRGAVRDRRPARKGLANALTQSSCDNQTCHFTGSQAYSFGDVAAALSKLSGKAVQYTPIEEAEFVEQMKERGIPDAMIEMVVSFPADIKNGQEEEVSPDLERWLGRKPTPLEEGLKSLFNF